MREEEDDDDRRVMRAGVRVMLARNALSHAERESEDELDVIVNHKREVKEEKMRDNEGIKIQDGRVQKR